MSSGFMMSVLCSFVCSLYSRFHVLRVCCSQMCMLYDDICVVFLLISIQLLLFVSNYLVDTAVYSLFSVGREKQSIGLVGTNL